MEELKILFGKIIQLEQAGQIEEAISCVEKLKGMFPNVGNLFVEAGKLKFRNQMWKEALFDFVEAYRIEPSEELRNLVLDAYYYPNEKTFQENLNKNLEYLQGWPHVFWDFADVTDIHPVWFDENVVVAYDATIDQFVMFHEFHRYERKDEYEAIDSDPILIDGSISMKRVEEVVSWVHCCAGAMLPLWIQEVVLFYEKQKFGIFVQTEVIRDTVAGEGQVWIVGEDQFRKFCNDTDYELVPRYYSMNDNLFSITRETYKQDLQRNKEIEQELSNYYIENSELIKERIRKQKPRIMVFVSSHTTVLQYHARDSVTSFRKMGCDCVLEKEKYLFSVMSKRKLLEALSSYRPDFIMVMDHFRFEFFEGISVPCVTWVQDPLDKIMDKRTPSKLSEGDFILNHFTTWKEFEDVGYPKKCLIDGPIPANHNIYNAKDLSEEEIEQYQCDICFVCHASDVEKHIERIIACMPEEYWDDIAKIYLCYIEYVRNAGDVFYSRKEFDNYIKLMIEELARDKWDVEIIGTLVDDMYLTFNQRVFRQVLVDWLIESGYTNIKLWGNGWLDNEKYMAYAMGAAENGETLSKIYQAAKIVVGNNTATTAAARAWESMLSGAFYLANYIPPEEDYTDIRMILEPNEYVMFQGKEDFLAKIKYYLENDEEREEMARRGHEAALKKMTFETTMERLLDELAKRI